LEEDNRRSGKCWLFSGDRGGDEGADKGGDAVGKEKEVMLNSSSNRKEGNGEKGVD
jgi:hypothetical protein